MSPIRPAFHFCLIFLVVSWSFPPAVAAQDDAQIKPVELILGSDGVLHGAAFQKDGRPAAGRTVVLGRAGKPIAKTVVDSSGKFQFKKIKPGAYQIATSEAAALLQCHSAEIAPRNSVKKIVLSQEAMIARGQQPASVLLNPLLIGLVVAAAIVIPIVVSNNDDAS